MPRIRTVKPEFYQDEDLAGVSETAFILALGLLNQSDDEGYFKANPMLIKSQVFPLREPSVSIHGALSELSNIGFIELFEGADGKNYGLVAGFTKHQTINRPTPSYIKGLRVITEDSVSAHGGLPVGKERKGKDIVADFIPDDEGADAQKNTQEPEDLKLAEFMFESIKSVIPKSKPPNLETWSNDIRLMRERDGLTLAEIKRVFLWVNRDSFWQTNIRSPRKLREKFPELHVKSSKTTKPAKSWEEEIGLSGVIS